MCLNICRFWIKNLESLDPASVMRKLKITAWKLQPWFNLERRIMFDRLCGAPHAPFSIVTDSCYFKASRGPSRERCMFGNARYREIRINFNQLPYLLWGKDRYLECSKNKIQNLKLELHTRFDLFHLYILYNMSLFIWYSVWIPN
jgi:hypothetical protein